MNEHLYVVTHEHGFGPEPLPIWTDQEGRLNLFDETPPSDMQRVDIDDVPGAFQLLNVLSDAEADSIVNIADSLGFHSDSPVSLPHSIRHNHNMNWIVSEAIDRTIWNRSAHLVIESVDGRHATGINARFRFYRYGTGDFFKPHTDGAWPGSRVVNGELIADAYPGMMSQYTYLIFLNDGYQGGKTQFMVSRSSPDKPAKRDDDIKLVSVRTPKGGVLCFPHGTHPLHCLHASEPITEGTKYIIRTDILFG